MTAQATAAFRQNTTVLQALIQSVTLVLLTFVLLMAGAALLNAAFGGAPIPDQAGKIAVALHLGVIFSAIPLSIAQFALPKGTHLHRTLGWIWCGLLFAASLVSFGVQELSPGSFTVPHAISIVTLICIPLIIFFARQHRVVWHRRMVGLIVSFIILAGSLAFIPGRVLGTLFWSIWS